MSERRSVIAVDLDGTIARKAWPGIGEPYPGAVEALRELHAEGNEILLFTYRISPYYFSGREREPMDVIEQTERTRAWLDRHGLTFVKLWTKPGKPNYHILIDDRAMWFPGRDGSWKVLGKRIRARLAAS